MAARAMWRGVVRFANERVAVKLYSAVEDRSVHFRLLHRKDRVPVRQVLVNAQTDEVVPYAESQRGYVTEAGDMVVLSSKELATVEPAKSRDIELVSLLPAGAIDHRWYLRPYYLGPDGAEEDYAALIGALRNSKREGLARWVMRNKTHVGALRLHRGYPVLISLRRAADVVAIDELEAPGGGKLDKKELAMATQLIDTLAADFEPEAYSNEHRERVLEMIETKKRGGRVKRPRPQRRRPSADLAGALEASLKRERNSA